MIKCDIVSVMSRLRCHTYTWVWKSNFVGQSCLGQRYWPSVATKSGSNKNRTARPNCGHFFWLIQTLKLPIVVRNKQDKTGVEKQDKKHLKNPVFSLDIVHL